MVAVMWSGASAGSPVIQAEPVVAVIDVESRLNIVCE